MRELEERIVRDGIVKAGNVLKVDAFLNHQCDVELFDHMGAEWARLFEGAGINKILTIEASGIGIACCASRHFGNVPVVFAKKAQSINLDGEQIRAKSMRIEVVPGALNVLQPLDIGHAEPIATAEAPKRPESSLSGRQ